MGRKLKRKNKPSRKSSSLFRWLISLISIFVLVFLLYPLTSKPHIQCANTLSCAESLKLNVDNNTSGIFNNHHVNVPKIDLSQKINDSNVLGIETATGEKHIYVDLAKQTLSAYEGNTLVFQTLISSGKWYPTPTGDFTIWAKLRSTRMTGGSGADYYDLPNVPFVMFFSNDQVSKGAGFSLHGAYWHNNFGHPMSHGCINMRQVDAQRIYNWVNPPTDGNTTYADTQNPGTKVTISGQAPL